MALRRGQAPISADMPVPMAANTPSIMSGRTSWAGLAMSAFRYASSAQ